MTSDVELPDATSPEVLALVEKLPRCEVCGTPQLTSAPCLFCRASGLEARLARLSFWGDDDWMRRIASLALEAEQAHHDGPHDRLIPLGFYQSPIPQGTFTVISRPQIMFRPEWLTIAPECADMGTLYDLKVGNRSQFINADMMPLSVFSPASWTSMEMMREIAGKFSWDTVAVAQDVGLVIDFTPAAQYDPLTLVALESVGRPRPTAFKAILWGRPPPEPPMRPIPEPPMLVHAGPESVKGIEATLQFADLMAKIRSGGIVLPKSRR